MQVLQIIPANVTPENIHYSSFIKNEINALENVGIEVIPYYFTTRLSFKGLLKSKQELKRKIKKENPVVIHAQFGSVTGLLMTLIKVKQPKFVTFGGNDLLGHPNKGFKWKIRSLLAVWMSDFTAFKADQIICVSNNLYNKLPHPAKRKSSIIPRGIALDEFSMISKAEARRQLNWDPSQEIILFSQVRNGAQVKNKPLAEQTVEALNQNYGKNAQLFLLIDMDKTEVNLALNAADALLVTSFHEGSPNIVKEAMACNLPVVTVPCGDVKERLIQTSPSYIGSYDPIDLAKGLKNVLTNNERSNGREELIRQGLEKEQTAIKIKNLYKTTLEVSKCVE